MKDFRDRFIRESTPKESEQQPPQRHAYSSYGPPAAEPAPRPEPSPPRAERPAPRPSIMPVPSARNKAATQTLLVSRPLVSVWGDRSFLADRVGTVQSGELLTVVEDGDEWLHVRCGTRLAGWVRTSELAPYQDPYSGLGEREDIF